MLAGSILHRLKEAHSGGSSGKRPLNFGVYYKNTLVSLCHALEDCILTCGSQPLVITAFQRGKWYLQEADRYGDLAQKSRQTVIMAAHDAGFAEHPTSQRSDVALVELDLSDPVAQEWHLMILAPTYTAMVLCQELSPQDYGPQGMPAEDRERKFYGFWTFEANLVQETVDLAIDHIGRYSPELQAQLRTHLLTVVEASQQASQDDMGAVVARVIDYLQHSQADLTQSVPSYLVSGGHPLDHNLTSNELQAFLRMAQLLDQTDLSNPMAAAEVAALAEAMAQLLDLPAWQVNRLKLAALLHRLAGFQQQSQGMLIPSSFGRYPEETTVVAPSCPLIPGTQVLRTMQRLRAIATIVTHQMERWDGQGVPAGLAGDEIPLESRILGLVAEFQLRLSQLRSASSSTTPEAAMVEALAACQAEQGQRWDPKLVDALALLVNGLQQGLSLAVSLPKIAAGMWLLDSHSDEDLLHLEERMEVGIGHRE